MPRDWKQFPCWPPLRHAYLNEDAAGAVRIIKKAGLIKGGRPENADNTRTGQLAPEKGGQLRRRLKQCTGQPGERMETLDEVARWGLNHDPPQQYGFMDPHFYSSSAATTRLVWSLPVLLLRAAVDIEVHGGVIEARSTADHVTLRPSDV